MTPNPPKFGLSDNSIAALAYFTPLLAVFFLAIRRYNKRPYVRFHAWQSLVFNIYVIFGNNILGKIRDDRKPLGPG